MNVYGLTGTADMGVRVSTEWYETVYTSVACAKCHALLRDAWDHPLDVDLDGAYLRGARPCGRFAQGAEMWLQALWGSEKRGLDGPLVTVSGAHVLIMWKDLAEDLGLVDHGFALGRVSVDGIVHDHYLSGVASRGARVMIQNEHVISRGVCSECGRHGRGLDFNVPFWFEAAAVAGRTVFANEIGKSLYVSEAGRSLIRPTTAAEMKFEAIEVRDDVGPDQMSD